VLIVEDDAELRWLTATLLEESEFDAIECESAEAALAVMLMRGQDVNMIFADIRLPGVMDGIDLACEVKMRWPHLIIVLTSGNPGERLEHMPPWRPIHAETVAAAQHTHGRRAGENAPAADDIAATDLVGLPFKSPQITPLARPSGTGTRCPSTAFYSRNARVRRHAPSVDIAAAGFRPLSEQIFQRPWAPAGRPPRRDNIAPGPCALGPGPRRARHRRRRLACTPAAGVGTRLGHAPARATPAAGKAAVPRMGAGHRRGDPSARHRRIHGFRCRPLRSDETVAATTAQRSCA
jgi:CheY-like chemotaxis protein